MQYLRQLNKGNTVIWTVIGIALTIVVPIATAMWGQISDAETRVGKIEVSEASQEATVSAMKDDIKDIKDSVHLILNRQK